MDKLNLHKFGLILTMLFTSSMGYGYSFTYNGLIYKWISGDNVWLTDVSKLPSDGKLVIPEKVYDSGELQYVTGIDDMGSGKKLENIKSIVIPDAIDHITAYSLTGCHNLVSLEYNVSNCSFFATINVTDDHSPFPSSISEVKIGANVKYIPKAFLSRNNSLKTIEIPNNVIGIGSFAFKECSNLRTIELGNRIEGIGEAAFSGCTNLRTLRTYAMEPPQIYDETFDDNTYKKCVLYVPIEAISKYKETSGWKNFSRIEAIPIPCEDIVLETSNVSIKVGESYSLVATIEPLNTTNPTITWKSDNESVAMVAPDGTIKGISVGTANITATCGTVSVTCIVTVNPILASEVVLNKQVVSLFVEDQEKLMATVTPDNVTDPTVIWTSDNEVVATVDSDGTVTGVSVGTANIIATCGAVSTMCRVIVHPIIASSVILNNRNLSLFVGENERLIATVEPTNTTYPTIAWESNNEAIATVDFDGTVTGVSVGTTDITATCGVVSATCRITVNPVIATAIRLSETDMLMIIGNTEKLVATIEPANTTSHTIIWKSDNESIVTVDQEGNVTAKTAGIANISAETTDGSNLVAVCRIVVGESVKQITIIPDFAVIDEDVTLPLSYVISPENAAYKNVVWTSENNDIATVDANGLVTTVSPGKVKIRATATDGSDVFGECELTVNVVTTEDNGICYQRNSTSTLKVVANPRKSYSGDLLIPSVALFNGREMSVTEIGADAFANCDKLTRLVIPSSVTKIQESTFKDCSNLIYVKICNGSSLASNLDILFSDSPIEELYIGSDRITYNSNSRLLEGIKRLTLGNNVSTFPPAKVFNTLQCFVVEDGDMPIIEPEDYCTKTMSLINKQTIKDSYTKIYYRSWYLITYKHLFPIIDAFEKSILDYVHIGREVQGVEVDTSKTQEKIPTTAGSRYQEYGYNDEIFYQYREVIATKDYNRNPIKSISFEQPDVELNVGEYVRLAVIFNPKDASFTTLEYTSSDEDIATVDAFGNVMKLSEGEAIITATTIDGSNLSTTCKIKDKASGISNVAIENLEKFDIYSLQGVLIRKNCKYKQSLNLTPGIYILRYGNRVEKIRIQ